MLEGELRDAIAGLLVSPAFLLRYTEGPSNSNFVVDETETSRRLARFLWLSIPDAELRELAQQGRLALPQLLESQVDRMIF